MTPDQRKDFEQHWPALAARVNRLLRRKKLSPWLVEDLTQETGLRLVRMWPAIDQAQPLWPLTATIALNLMRDEMRRDGSHQLTYDVPDTASAENVERRGMARLELREVGGALSQMADTHRRVLLAEVSDADRVPDASATRMLRMRARRKLQNLVDHASLLGIAVGDQLRRAAREAELMISKALPNHIEHVSAGAVSVLAAVSLGIAIVPGASTEAGEGARTAPGATTAIEGGVDGAISHSARSGSPEAGRAGSRRDGTRTTPRDEAKRSKRRGTGGDAGGEDQPPFPGAVNYGVTLTDDTYVNGTLEAQIIDEEEPGSRDASVPRGPGSINCTVSPSSSAASCTHGGDGWGERGIRAGHKGEAVVAGRRVY